MAIYPLIVQAERLADKPAVIEDRPNGSVRPSWTYAELNRQANRLANAFRDLGLGPASKRRLVRAELAGRRARRCTRARRWARRRCRSTIG